MINEANENGAGSSPGGDEDPEDLSGGASTPEVSGAAKVRSRPSAPSADLSREIIARIARDAGQQVTCSRVAPDRYRCNWWMKQNTSVYDNPSILGSLATTSRICRSHYLHVTKSGESLTIIAITPGARQAIAQVA